jgi:thiamine pyrophosphokinase
MTALIFANGVLNMSSRVREAIEASGLIIAADGGAKHCLSLGIIPHVIIGDFDSLEEEIIESFREQGARVVRHPARKDHTDLELAVLYAIETGAEEVLVLGALGKRWDQTLANLLMPAAEAFRAIVIRLIDGQQEINLVRSGQELALKGSPGDTVSLIPLWGDADGITTVGLEYPLDGETLVFGSTRGISNVLNGKQALVSLDRGLLVAVLIHAEEQGGNEK